MLTAEVHWGNRDSYGAESSGRSLDNFHRTYDPGTGRYLETDPIGQPGGINLYIYAENNPLTFSDPLGFYSTPYYHFFDYNELPNPLAHLSDLYDYSRLMRLWGHGLFPGEANSRMRHCVVSCMVASGYGEWWARGAGGANELQGLILHDVPDLLGRLRGKRPWAFQWEDLLANEDGFDCANPPCPNPPSPPLDTAAKCIACCRSKP